MNKPVLTNQATKNFLPGNSSASVPLPAVTSRMNGLPQAPPDPKSLKTDLRTANPGSHSGHSNSVQPPPSGNMNHIIPPAYVHQHPPPAARTEFHNVHPQGLGAVPSGLTPQQLLEIRKAHEEQKERYRKHEEAQKEQQRKQQKQREEANAAKQFEQEHEHDGMAEGDTFATYVPSKLTVGNPHPDVCVETATMSSVEPPNITYELHLPQEIIDHVHLSSLQLEAIVYACQSHEKLLPNGDRQGFLIGDGAGVGKGRTIAGIIFENYLQGRKRAVWMSVSADLIHDAERDLDDVDAPGNIEVRTITDFNYGFSLESNANANDKGRRFEEGVLYSTYSSLIASSSTCKNKYKRRLDQIVDWCGGIEFDGILVFDECHRAKHLVQLGKTKTATKTAQAVFDIQQKLPKARVVYASATGASEIRNTAFMVRLGLWGQGCLYEDFKTFCTAIEARGVAGLEITAMELKLRGLYCARQLSFTGASFDITEMPVDEEFIKLYNDCVDFWCRSRDAFEQAAQEFAAPKKRINMMWAQFYGAQQRFFKYLCLSVKAPFVAKLALDAVAAGKCAVIGLQSTGEARTREEMEQRAGGDEIDDFVSTARATFDSLLDTQFPGARSMLNIAEVRTDRKENDEPLPRHRRAKLAAQNALTQGAGGNGGLVTDSFDTALNRLRARRDEKLKEVANDKKGKKVTRASRSNSVANSVKSEDGADAFSWARSSDSRSASLASTVADDAGSAAKKKRGRPPRKHSPADSEASNASSRVGRRKRTQHAGGTRRNGPSTLKKRPKIEEDLAEIEEQTEGEEELVTPRNTRRRGRIANYREDDDENSNAGADVGPSTSAAARCKPSTSSARIADLRGGGNRGRPPTKKVPVKSTSKSGHNGKSAEDCIEISDDEDDAASSATTLTKASFQKMFPRNDKMLSSRRHIKAESDEHSEIGEKLPQQAKAAQRPQRQQKLKAMDAIKRNATLGASSSTRRAADSDSESDSAEKKVDASIKNHRSPPKRAKTDEEMGDKNRKAVKDFVISSPEGQDDVDGDDDEFGLLNGVVEKSPSPDSGTRKIVKPKSSAVLKKTSPVKSRNTRVKAVDDNDDASENEVERSSNGDNSGKSKNSTSPLNSIDKRKAEKNIKVGNTATRGRRATAKPSTRSNVNGRRTNWHDDSDAEVEKSDSDADQDSDSDFTLAEEEDEDVVGKASAKKFSKSAGETDGVKSDDDDDAATTVSNANENPASVQTVASSAGTVSSCGYRPWDLVDEHAINFAGSDDDDDNLPDPWMVCLKQKRKAYIDAYKTKQAIDSVPDLKIGRAAKRNNIILGLIDSDEEDELNGEIPHGRNNDVAAAAGGAGVKLEKIDESKLPGKAEFDLAKTLYCDLKREFAEKLGPRLPPNPLDYLIDTLGGTTKVAELTGRKIRIARGEDGTIRCAKRNVDDDTKLDQMNMVEKRRFMDGEKLIAVISEAASSGISLQADRRVLNQRRRVHLTLELPWAAESAVQQFGRTHRSNQVSAPEYRLITSGICGENRFAASVAKRLNMLGALTRGDRRAADASDLTEFNVDNKYGRKALNHVLKVALGVDQPKDTEALREYEGIDADTTDCGGTSKFVGDMRRSFIRAGIFKGDEFYDVMRKAEVVEKMISIPRFLNRLMCMHVSVQNAVFEYLNFTMETLLSTARAEGKLDNGIMEIGSDSHSVKLEKSTTMKMTAADGTSAKKDHSDRTLLVSLNEVSLNRGLTWEQAQEMLASYKERQPDNDPIKKDRSGFYLNVPHRVLNKYLVSLALRCANQRHVHPSFRRYTMYKPNIGLAKNETYADLSEKCKQAITEKDMGIAERAWKEIYEKSGQNCLHKYWDNKCMATMRGEVCDFGQRECRYHVLTGSLLTIMSDLEYAVGAEETRRMLKLVRVRTSDEHRIVGMYVPRHHLNHVIKILRLKEVNSAGMIKGEYLASMPVLLKPDPAPSSSSAAAVAVTSAAPPPPPVWRVGDVRVKSEV